MEPSRMPPEFLFYRTCDDDMKCDPPFNYSILDHPETQSRNNVSEVETLSNDATQQLNKRIYIPSGVCQEIKDRFIRQCISSDGQATDEELATKWSPIFVEVPAEDSREITDRELNACRVLFLIGDQNILFDTVYKRCLLTHITPWFHTILAFTLVKRFGINDAKVSMNKNVPYPILLAIEDTFFTYIPKCDIMVEIFRYPLLLCEIDSMVKLHDENKMLALATFYARVTSWASKKPITILAIFFAAHSSSLRMGKATIYQVTSFDNGKKVYVTTTHVRVTSTLGTLQLLRIIANYAEYIATILPKLEEPLTKDAISELISSTANLQSRSAVFQAELIADEEGRSKKRRRRGGGGGSGGAGGGASGRRGGGASGSGGGSGGGRRGGGNSGSKGHKTGDQGTGPTESVENDTTSSSRPIKKHRKQRGNSSLPVARQQTCDVFEEGFDGDDLDAKRRLTPHVREELRQELLKQGVTLVTVGVRLLPPQFIYGQVSSGRLVAIKLTTRQEVKIHRVLCEEHPPCQYILPMLCHTNPSPDLHFIVTPLRSPLLNVNPKVTNANATALMTHLLLGLTFIHKNTIAHLDIRPHNLVVCVPEMRLEIIDFGLSIKFQNPNTTIQGFRGYMPWVAAEVKSGGYFNPFSADLWACGRVLQSYQGHISESLVQLSNGLMAEDPPTRTLSMEAGMKKIHQVYCRSLRRSARRRLGD